jgi:hypothetical protein
MDDFMSNPNPTEQFERDIANIVNAAAKNGVHPAIVHTLLCGLAQDVMFSIKRSAQMAAAAAQAAKDKETAESILKPKPKATTTNHENEPTPDTKN